jgi:hypothetical protein
MNMSGESGEAYEPRLLDMQMRRAECIAARRGLADVHDVPQAGRVADRGAEDAGRVVWLACRRRWTRRRLKELQGRRLMGQHYTRDTVEVSAYCTRCGKMTPHTVSDRRLGYCIPCYERPIEKAPAAVPAAAPQPGLFDQMEKES